MPDKQNDSQAASEPQVRSSALLVLASKWEAKAKEYTDRFNELTYGDRSVGGMDATIAALKHHAKELREIIEAARANKDSTTPVR